MHPSILIDEIPEDKLEWELNRRRKLRWAGKCDYCERPPDTTPCKFPNRHMDPRIIKLGSQVVYKKVE